MLSIRYENIYFFYKTRFISEYMDKLRKQSTRTVKEGVIVLAHQKWIQRTKVCEEMKANI